MIEANRFSYLLNGLCVVRIGWNWTTLCQSWRISSWEHDSEVQTKPAKQWVWETTAGERSSIGNNLLAFWTVIISLLIIITLVIPLQDQLKAQATGKTENLISRVDKNNSVSGSKIVQHQLLNASPITDPVAASWPWPQQWEPDISSFGLWL